MFTIIYQNKEYHEKYPLLVTDFLKKNNHQFPLLCSINTRISDLNTLVSQNCTIKPLNFDSKIGQQTFWHSSAHLLCLGLQIFDKNCLISKCYSNKNGFYVDVKLSFSLKKEHYESIDKILKDLLKKGLFYTKCKKSINEVTDHFGDNEFKSYYIQKHMANNYVKERRGSIVYLINDKEDDKKCLNSCFTRSSFEDSETDQNVYYEESMSGSENDQETIDSENEYNEGSVEDLQNMSIEGGNQPQELFNSKNFSQELSLHSIEDSKIVESNPNANLSSDPEISDLSDIDNLPHVSCYKLGDHLDICEGPHLHSTHPIRAIKTIHHSSSYFLGNKNNKTLTRVYGISFPTQNELKSYLQLQESLKQKDHRRLGTDLNLFFFHEYSPGCCFFLPKGAFMYNKLQTHLRNEYRKRNYQEVITPNIFSTALWEKSGHFQNYKENMFLLPIDNQENALKPMNCPSHCLIYKNTTRSYKNLPLKLADFGVLHRNEFSGALSGLTRVRRFVQDDAHIFCTKNQIQTQIIECLQFLHDFYTKFGFKYELKLSTRPDNYLGSLDIWDHAENELKSAMKNYEFEINEKDGAFYGPKIDIILEDAFNRKHQCATIQLDFQLPLRFNLKYLNENKELEYCVIIHRAILGSIERFIAILLENFGKKLPFWINPNQIVIICCNERNLEYCLKVKNMLIDFEVDMIADNSLTLNKKIRKAMDTGYKFVLVCGDIEEKTNTVNLRNIGSKSVKEFKKICEKMVKEFKEYDEIQHESE